MLNKLIHLALRNRAIVIAFSLLLLAAGVKTTRELPVEVLPDLTKPIGGIVTACPARLGSVRQRATYLTPASPAAYRPAACNSCVLLLSQPSSPSRCCSALGSRSSGIAAMMRSRRRRNVRLEWSRIIPALAMETARLRITTASACAISTSPASGRGLRGWIVFRCR